MTRRVILTFLVMVACCCWGTTAVRADTITVHDLGQNTVLGIFMYTVEFDAASSLRNGDGFVIYDFAGETSWTLGPAYASTGSTPVNQGGFAVGPFTLDGTVSSNTLTLNGAVDAIAGAAAVANAIPFDDPLIPNLTFRWTGGNVALAGPVFATLTVHTSLHGKTTSVFGSEDHQPNGSFSFAGNPVMVPAPAAVPMPSAAGAGLALLGLVGIRRITSSVAARN